jgi:acrylyl-CoA reductase (NADPH)
MDVRVSAWERLARDVPRQTLRSMTRTIPLDGIIEAAGEIVEGRIQGRTVVALDS